MTTALHLGTKEAQLTSTLEGHLSLRVKAKVTQALPPFAMAAIQIGRESFKAAFCGAQRTVVLVVPTRSYFALFVAAGAVEAALVHREGASFNEPPVGKPVVAINADGTYQSGVFNGYDSTVAKGVVTSVKWLQLKGNKKVTVSAETPLLEVPEADFKPTAGFDCKEIPTHLVDIAGAYGRSSLRSLLGAQAAPTRIVGVKKALSAELAQEFLVQSDSGPSNLSFDDLFLMKRSPVTSPLVEIVTPEAASGSATSAMVEIMDGASAVLRKGLDSSNASRIVVLDASSVEASLSSAVNTVYNDTVFAHPDPGWVPMRHPGLKGTEWAVFKTGTGAA